MSESRQHWLDRNRPPRVQITYDVETLGSSAKQEIPFVAGVMGDFAGPGNRAAGKTLSERGFVEIDRDNFDQVMAAQQASLNLGTKKLRGVSLGTGADGKPAYMVSTADGAAATDVGVMLNITSLDDFGPRAILEQLGSRAEGSAIAEMMKTRQYLSELLTKIQGNVVNADTLVSESRAALLPNAIAALQAAGLLIAPAITALNAFGEGATGDGKFDTAGFADADKAAFTAAMAEVTTAAGTGKTAVDGMLAALTPTSDAATAKAAADKLDALRAKVDAAVGKLNTAVANLTDTGKKSAADPLAKTATSRARALGDQTGRARAALDSATKFATAPN